MDSVTEKFSVFDFFNLIIGGIIFLLGVGSCHYAEVIAIGTVISELLSDNDFLLFVAIVLFISLSFIIGSTINELAHLFFVYILQWEKRMIEGCLNNNHLIENNIKLNVFREKAVNHFKIKEFATCENFSVEQCTTFFAYCVYYLHVRNQDKKTEKMRETQDLAELLTLVFALIPITSIIIYLFLGTSCLNPKPTFAIYILCVIFACAFLNRSKRAMENRIRMVLAIYDACIDKEKETTNHVVSQDGY